MHKTLQQYRKAIYFEALTMAKYMLFVVLDADRSALVAGTSQITSIIVFHTNGQEDRFWELCTPQTLGLHDGRGWRLDALKRFIDAHVGRVCKCGCGQPLQGTSRRQYYSAACRQKAYRGRK